MDLISVVVPVYNVEKYLSECVESIVKQSYKNLEIILVDDGSTDNSGIICDEFSKIDNRIIVIHKENGGLSDARNVGIKNAKGQFIYLIDSDDFIANEFVIEKMNNLLTEDIDIVVAYCYEKRNEENIYCKYDKDIQGIILTPSQAIGLMYEWKTHKYNLTVAHNKLYRKKLFVDIEYPLGKLHEDEFTTYKLYLKSRKIAMLNDSTYAYRIREDSIMTSDYNAKRLDIFKAYRERTEILKDLGYRELVKKTKDYYFHSILSNRFILYKNKMKEYNYANEEYRKFLSKNPKYIFKPINFLFFISKLKYIIFNK